MLNNEEGISVAKSFMTSLLLRADDWAATIKSFITLLSFASVLWVSGEPSLGGLANECLLFSDILSASIFVFESTLSS